MSKLIISLLLFSANILLCNGANVRKCCPNGESLNSTLDGCIKVNDTVPLTNSQNLDIAVPRKNENYLPCARNNHAIPSTKLSSGNLEISESTGSLLDQRTGRELKNHEFCLDSFSKGEGDVAVAVVCPCAKQNKSGGPSVCVYTCCSPGQIYMTGSSCEAAPSKWSNWSLKNLSADVKSTSSEVWNVISHCDSHVLNDMDEYKYTLLSNGTLLIITEDQADKKEWLPSSDFCVSPMIYENGTIREDVIRCFGADNEEEQDYLFMVYAVMGLVGAFFLLATLVVHALTPRLRRNLRGKSLMSHCFCMMVAQILLAVLQLEGAALPDAPCYSLAYITQFFFLAGFCWMNVVCIAIASTFRSLLSMVQSGASAMRKFLYLSIGANGFPLLVVLVTMIVDKTDAPENLKSGIGDGKCWFGNTGLPIALFFYGPLGVILVFNLFLLIYTAVKIAVLSNQPSMVNQAESRRHGTKYSQLSLILKLFFLMGIPWMMEIISWQVDGPREYWILTDAFNLLRSVVIFFMFCWKKKIWTELVYGQKWIPNKFSVRLAKPPSNRPVDTSSTDSEGQDASSASGQQRNSTVNTRTRAIGLESTTTIISDVAGQTYDPEKHGDTQL